MSRTDQIIAEVSQDTDLRKVAVLDLGSNSFHLVVARIVAQAVQVLHRMKLSVRLAEGLDENNWLSAEAMEHGLDHLRLLAESLQDFNPDAVRIIATHALRTARNAHDFRTAAKQILPCQVDIISGAEEARLIYMGIAHTLHHDGHRLVIDIGGGSTETIVGQGFDPELCFSLSMGCVSYTQRFFADGSITRKNMKQAIRSAEQEAVAVSKSLLQSGWDYCIGSSGTIAAIGRAASVTSKGITDQGITLADLEALMEVCINAGTTEKLAFGNISEQRQHLLPAGLAISIGLFRTLNISSLIYSPAALREGALFDMHESLAYQDIRQRTAQSLVTRYLIDVDQARRVEATAHQLLDQVRNTWNLSDVKLGDLLSWSALLHETGLQINSRQMHRHGEYILKHVDMPGFSLEQQQLLATLVRFQRKKPRNEAFDHFLHYTLADISRLLVLLRLSVLLNFNRQDNLLPSINIQATGSTLTLQFPKDWLQDHPVINAHLEQEQHYLKALDIHLNFH